MATGDAPTALRRGAALAGVVATSRESMCPFLQKNSRGNIWIQLHVPAVGVARPAATEGGPPLWQERRAPQRPAPARLPVADAMTRSGRARARVTQRASPVAGAAARTRGVSPPLPRPS